jgi:hypothetical protein
MTMRGASQCRTHGPDTGPEPAGPAPAPWPEQTYLVGHAERFVFCPIPKVICTNLKKGLLRLVGLQEAHGHESFNQCAVHGDVHTCAQQELCLQTTAEMGCLHDDRYFRFAFVRNPWARLVSAYLDKIGRAEQPPMGRALDVIVGMQRHHGRPTDLVRRISFRVFLESTLLMSDLQLDEHWRPQATFLGGHTFDFIGRFEAAAAGFAAVNAQLGTELEVAARNTVGWAAAAPAEGGFFDGHDSLELQVVRERLGGFPDFLRFYPPDLRELVGQRYAVDVAR